MRYLLDTCVLSELVKPRPSPTVRRWVGDQDEHTLYLSVMTLGELNKGIARLPPGGRRDRLESWVEQDLAGRFEGRILPVDAAVAAAWGRMLGAAENRGQPLPVVDALIAATARVNACAVVTRNVSDLERTGIDLIDPWRATP